MELDLCKIFRSIYGNKDLQIHIWKCLDQETWFPFIRATFKVKLRPAKADVSRKDTFSGPSETMNKVNREAGQEATREAI